MPIVGFETADSPERARIGEGLVRFAAGRLETGREEGWSFLRRGDGCAEGGGPIRQGEPFYFDTATGEERRPDG